MGRYMQDPGSWMDGGVGQEAEERMGSSAGCLEFEVLGQGQPRANAGLHSLGLVGQQSRAPGGGLSAEGCGREGPCGGRRWTEPGSLPSLPRLLSSALGNESQ